MKFVRITHKASGMSLAEGPIGWGITPFEGNYYIRRKYLATDRLQPNFIPGLCVYKFLYVWLDLCLDDGRRVKNLGWFYRLPNPLLPFIALERRCPVQIPSWRSRDMKFDILSRIATGTQGEFPGAVAAR